MTTLVVGVVLSLFLALQSKENLRLFNISGMTGYAWLRSQSTTTRFRRAYKKQKRNLAGLLYQAGLFPLGPVLAFFVSADYV